MPAMQVHASHAGRGMLPGVLDGVLARISMELFSQLMDHDLAQARVVWGASSGLPPQGWQKRNLQPGRR